MCPKADSLYPIVSAASIVAKTARDRQQAAIAGNAGSGYPADPLTKAWLLANLRPYHGFPDEVRLASALRRGGPTICRCPVVPCLLHRPFACATAAQHLVENQPVLGKRIVMRRFSWQPVAKLLREQPVRLEFAADGSDERQAPLAFASGPTPAVSMAAERHSFFRSRRLQLLTPDAWS